METKLYTEESLKDLLMGNDLPQVLDARLEQSFENFRRDLANHPYVLHDAAKPERHAWLRIKLRYRWIAVLLMLFGLPLVTSAGRETASRLIATGMDEFEELTRDIPYFQSLKTRDAKRFNKFQQDAFSLPPPTLLNAVVDRVVGETAMGSKLFLVMHNGEKEDFSQQTLAKGRGLSVQSDLRIPITSLWSIDVATGEMVPIQDGHFVDDPSLYKPTLNARAGALVFRTQMEPATLKTDEESNWPGRLTERFRQLWIAYPDGLKVLVLDTKTIPGWSLGQALLSPDGSKLICNLVNSSQINQGRYKNLIYDVSSRSKLEWRETALPSEPLFWAVDGHSIVVKQGVGHYQRVSLDGQNMLEETDALAGQNSLAFEQCDGLNHFLAISRPDNQTDSSEDRVSIFSINPLRLLTVKEGAFAWWMPNGEQAMIRRILPDQHYSPQSIIYDVITNQTKTLDLAQLDAVGIFGMQHINPMAWWIISPDSKYFPAFLDQTKANADFEKGGRRIYVSEAAATTETAFGLINIPSQRIEQRFDPQICPTAGMWNPNSRQLAVLARSKINFAEESTWLCNANSGESHQIKLPGYRPLVWIDESRLLLTNRLNHSNEKINTLEPLRIVSIDTRSWVTVPLNLRQKNTK